MSVKKVAGSHLQSTLKTAVLPRMTLSLKNQVGTVFALFPSFSDTV